ncbi:PmbA/TldA family metallopeptidase, partial [Morganella morganii]|uniref:PmbA/TldA family metallopeptidase n=1 Tax=Morganella morganii TaxID=582 RepID=UPI002494B487
EALAKADDGELYLQYRATESFGFDDRRLKTADYSTDAGFGLRAVSGEMTGFAHASDISAGEALAKADDGELYLQYRATESFGFDDRRLKTAD